MSRKGECERKTKETVISVSLDIDGEGKVAVSTGLPFFDHMLELMCRHALFDARIEATGDLEVDSHHTVEDTGLVLGYSLSEALGDKLGITRFGFALVPMDECLAQVVIDISGRPYLYYEADILPEKGVNFEPALARDFFKALSDQAGLTMHIELKRSGGMHHSLEAIFKACGRALKQAISIDPRVKGIPSTKGLI